MGLKGKDLKYLFLFDVKIKSDQNGIESDHGYHWLYVADEDKIRPKWD